MLEIQINATIIVKFTSYFSIYTTSFEENNHIHLKKMQNEDAAGKN